MSGGFVAREYHGRVVVRAAAGGGVADKPVTTPDKSKQSSILILTLVFSVVVMD